MGKSEAGKAESAKSSADDLTGRRILITGAARNIGSSLARRLYDRGASVGLLGLEPELLEQVATSCGRAPWQLCDVADLEQVSRGVDYIAEKLGGIDVVVANAGVEANSSILGGDLRTCAAPSKSTSWARTTPCAQQVRTSVTKTVTPGGRLGPRRRQASVSRTVRCFARRRRSVG